MKMVRTNDGQMGGGGKFTLLKGSGIYDIPCPFPQLGSGCKGKALVAGSPDSHLLIPGIQILHIGLHLPLQINITLQQVLRIHLRTLFHNNGKGVPVNDLALLHQETVAL